MNAIDELAGIKRNSPVFYDPFRYWIAIVGIGAGGASVFAALIDRIGASELAKNVGFILFDPRDESEHGKGVAWSSIQHQAFRANMRLHTIGFKKNLIDNIIKAAGIDSIDDPSLLTDKILFHERRKIGDALHQDFTDYVQKARGLDIPCHIVQATAQDINRYHNGYNVDTGDSGEYFCHYIVLATGNFPNNIHPHLRGCPGYIFNPWDWNAYDKIKSDSKVAVVGLGPTAVDTIIFLNERGVNSITASSREGRMQYPRPHNRPHALSVLSPNRFKELIELKFKTNGTGLSYDSLFTLLQIEFEEAKACAGFKDALAKSKLPTRQALLAGLGDCQQESIWYSVMKALDEVR